MKQWDWMLTLNASIASAIIKCFIHILLNIHNVPNGIIKSQMFASITEHWAHIFPIAVKRCWWWFFSLQILLHLEQFCALYLPFPSIPMVAYHWWKCYKLRLLFGTHFVLSSFDIFSYPKKIEMTSCSATKTSVKH